MTNRILDLAGSGADLRVEYEQLKIEAGGSLAGSVPLADVAAVVLANPQIRCSHAALAGLMRHGAAVVCCDEKCLPLGLMLPLRGHSTQAERFAAQAAASLPTRKRLWRQIVRGKILAQAELLTAVRGTDAGLPGLAAAVRSGDRENIEARAAQRYWPLLFDDPTFRRRREAPDQNRYLNYGYAVLRAITARAIVAAGLHPGLGLHHHNRYDAYCLAADLMEPYRPAVDAAVLECVRTYGPDAALIPAVKQVLLAPLVSRFCSGGQARTLFDLAAHTAASLARVFLGEEDKLVLPESLRPMEAPDRAAD